MTETDKKHHLLITGTGRTGTTFLVKLLTMLDIDTGFTKDFLPISDEAQAGLEHHGLGGDYPYVVKNPKLMWELPGLIASNPVVIDHVLVPIRNIHAAAESRRANMRKASPNAEPKEVVGGLEGVDNPEDQEAFFLKKFFHFFHFASTYQIPVILLHYPRLVLDGEYLYRKLHFLLGNVTRERFLEIFNEVADPSIVNCYNENDGLVLEYDDTENIKELTTESSQLKTEVLQLQAIVQQLKSKFSAKESQLQQQVEALQQQNQLLQKEDDRMKSSRSWRYTSFFRFWGALLKWDKQYFYDFAQKTRNDIWHFRQNTKRKHPKFSCYFVEPVFKYSIRILKPICRRILSLFLSGKDGYSFQRQWLPVAYKSHYEGNQDFLSFSTDVKAIAFYLPQFYPLLENDQWLGESFTEWTNTEKARPLFEGHYQPRQPHDDIGHYDLTDINVLKQQVEQARTHGIYGFCFYHYYFSGKRFVEKPTEMLLEHSEIDIQFCLCWNNESLTKKWDGIDHGFSIAQEYSAEDDIHFISDVVRYMKDPRYIKVNSKPVLMVYCPLSLKEPKATFERWRQYCRENDIGEIVIWVTRKGFNRETGLGLEDVSDAEIELPPHLTASTQWIPRSSVKGNQLKKPLVDYKSLVDNIISKNAVSDKLSHPTYRTVTLGWDNTAHRKDMAHVYWGFTPQLYYKWLRYIVEDTRRKHDDDERFVFINAWNAWSEGTYIEPDKKYGYTNINTTSKAIFDLPFSYGTVSKKKMSGKAGTVELNDLVSQSEVPSQSTRVAVHAHVYYTNMLDDLIYYMNHIPKPFDCYLTTDTANKKDNITQKISGRLNAQNIELRITPNVGRDVAPFLVGCRDVIDAYDYVCHIHTKRSPHVAFGNHWREHLFDHLLGSRKLVCGILSHFANHPDVGLIYPPVFSGVSHRATWQDNKQQIQSLLNKIGIELELQTMPAFPAGTMFWMRANAFENLFNAGITYDDFEEEKGQLDGTLAHAFERALVCVAEHNGYSCQSLV